MIFSFISNGLVWQEFVSRLFVSDRNRPTSPVNGFKTISAERLRDYGLDGIDATSNGTIFQMYFPLWEAGEPRYKRVNNKLSETCRKLKKNITKIEQIIGVPLRLLILVIPENPDVEMREHERKLEEKMSFKIDIWGETEVAAILSRHPDAVKDLLPFPVESVNIEKILETAYKHHNQGNFLKAREYYEKAEFYTSIYGDCKSRCCAKEGLASLLYEIGELPLAEEYGIDAVKLARSDDQKSLPKILIILAQIQGSLGKHKLSEKLLNEALSFARKHEKIKLIPEIEAFQGRLALSLGKLEKARSLFNKCFKPLKEEGGILFVIILEFKSKLSKTENNIKSAIHYLEQAIEVAEKETYPLLIGKLVMELAELHFSQKLFNKTHQLLEKAETCFHKSGQIKKELLAKLYIAKTFIFQGNNSAAIAILPSIIDKAHQIAIYFIAGEANLLLADVAIQSKEWQKALNYAQAGYKDFVWEHSLHGQIHASLVMGRIAEKAAEVLNGIEMQVKAEEFRLQAMKHLEVALASSTKVSSDLIITVRTDLAHSKEINGKFEESITILKTIQPESLLNKEKFKFAQKLIKTGVKRCLEKIRIRELFKKVKNHGKPLEWAQTKPSNTIQDAHAKIYSILLEWMDIWPKARCELLDFWGRGNFLKLLLNHQAMEKGQLENAFTLCVEVTTVEQADLACRILYPIVDCLILIWKGVMEEGITIVPQHEDYCGAGGWGYMTCSDIVKPQREGTGTWYVAVGWANPLPKEIVDFIFVKARSMVERGRLVLIPASLIGCEFRGHGYFEKLLIQELLNASPVIIEVSKGQPHISGFPIVIPYFPQASLADIAKMVDDYEDILLKTRIACLEWGNYVHKESGELSDHKKQIILTHIKEVFYRIKTTFQNISGKMPSNSPFSLTDDVINPSAIFTSIPKVAPATKSLASSGLYTALQNDALPWYPFWKLQSMIGGHWKLAGPKLPPPQYRKIQSKRFETMVHNKTTACWIQPPEGGWTIPTAIRI